MTTHKESEVLVEVRRIKEGIAKEASKIGFEKYYLSLNGRAAELKAKYRTKRPRPKSVRP